MEAPRAPRSIVPVFAAVLLVLASPALAQTITLPALPNIGSGLQSSAQTATLSVAQHGGKTVRIESDNPSLVLVSTGVNTLGAGFIDVFVPNGSTTVTFVLQALENVTGSATITASTPGFTGANRTAIVVQPACDVIGLVASIDTLDPADLFQIRVGLPNAGGTAVSPTQSVRAGGSAVTVTIVNSTSLVGELITTPTTGQTVTVSIAPGNTMSASSVAAGGVAFDGLAVGSTAVSASIPGYISTTNATHSVAVTQPTIAFPTLGSVGSGLQGSPHGLTLSASEHGGVMLHIESADPAVALVAPNAATAGTASIDVAIPNGSTVGSFVLSGLEGVTGSSLITASVTGFVSASQLANVFQPAVDIIGLPTSIDTLDPVDPFQVRVGLPNGGNTAVNPSQSIRAGGSPLTVTLAGSLAAAGDFITTSLTADTVTVTIPVGASTSPSVVATGGVAFDGVALGSTVVSARTPGFIATTNANVTVSVTQPGITLNSIGNIGSGLQGAGNGITLGASQHGGVTVHVESSDPSVALISPSPGTAGSASFDVALANGSTALNVIISGMENVTGTSTITVSAPGFSSASRPVTIAQPACDLIGLLSSLDTLDPSDAFQVRVGLASAGNVNVNNSQQARVGGPGLTATIVHSNHPVADLITTPLVGDSVVVAIAPGSTTSPSQVVNGGVSFDGTALGSSTVSVSIPGFTSTTSAYQSVTVTQPSISVLSIGNVGAGLQSAGNNVTLSVSQHGGVTVHIESSNPSVALVSPELDMPGTASFNAVVLNGTTFTSFFVHGVDNVTGTSTIQITAPGFVGASPVATIVQPAVDIINLASTMDVSVADDPFQVRVGLPNASNTAVNPIQNVRAGSPGLTATVLVSNPAVGLLVTTPETDDTVTVVIPELTSVSRTTVVGGGAAFNPIAIGTTLVAASIPGFAPTGAATQQVLVTQRIITMNGIDNVGAALQTGPISGALGLAAHGGVTVHVASSDPAIALVSPAFATAGSASIDFPLADQSTQFFFYVHGIATGSATITASAPTFTSANRTANVVQAALQVDLLADSLDEIDANDPFVVRVGIPAGDNSSVATAQVVRAGGGAVTVSVSSSNDAAAELVTSTENGSPVTVSIPAGVSQSAGSASLGGVELDPLLPGTTVVSATSAGLIATTAASHAMIIGDHPDPTGVGDPPVPDAFALRGNVPNPFNPVTTISFDIPAGGAQVNLSVYDVSGRIVRALVDDHLAAGTWSVPWRGDDDRGQPVASGVYFYRMRGGGFVDTKKMVLLK